MLIATKEDFDRLEAKIDLLLKMLNNPVIVEDDYLTLEEVAALFGGVSRNTLKSWHVRGELRQVKKGRLVYYLKSEVFKYKASR